MKAPQGNTSIVFGRFTLFYTTPIVFVLFAIKYLFGSNFSLALGVALWDAIVMCFLFFFLQIIFSRRFRPEKGKLSSLYFTRQRIAPGDFDEAFRRSVQAAESLKGFRILEYERDDGYFIGITGATMHSLGELVRVDVWQIGDKNSKVKVTSRPAFNASFADRGKNRDNVTLLITRFPKPY